MYINNMAETQDKKPQVELKEAPIKTAKIRAMLGRRVGVKEKDIAELLGTKPQNFSRKMAIGSFTFEEMKKIGEYLGASWHEEHKYYFTTKTGVNYNLRFYFKGPYSEDCLDGAVNVILSCFKGQKQKKIKDVRHGLEGEGFYVLANEFPNNEAQEDFLRYVLGETELRAIAGHYVNSLTVEQQEIAGSTDT
jgi:hypothetical protein